MRRRIVIGLIGPLVSVAALALVLSSVNLGRTAQAISRAQPLMLVPVLALVAVGIGLRSWRWQRLLPGVAKVPVPRVVPIVLIGYLGNAVLPARLGEPIRAYLLARREHLSSFEVLGTALLERVVDVAVLAVLAFACGFALGAPGWVTQLTALAAAGGMVIVAILTFVGLAPIVRVLHRYVDRLPRADQVLARLDRFASGIGGRAQRGPVMQATAISLPIWLVDTTICWLVAAGLGLSVNPPQALLIVAVGALGTSVPSAPGYIGTYELAASAAGRAIGLDSASAFGLALVLHAVTLIPVALAGAVSLVMLGAGSLREIAAEATQEPEASG